MKAKISKKIKRLGLVTILGILIILTGIILTIVILVDSRGGTGTDPVLETHGEEAIDPNDETPNNILDDNTEVYPEYVTIEYRGLSFTIPTSWNVQDTEDGLTIGIVEEGQANILFIETMTSNIELPLENNLALVSSIFSESIPDLEREAILISGLPALMHQYEITVDDADYNIVGFLFPNGDELIYIQFGTPIGEAVNQELLRFVTRMIITLELPPSEFPPME